MKPSHNILLTFGINGSLRKREIQFPVSSQNTEYYLFNSAANLKAYSNNGLDFAYYGYNASNTRTYKLSMQNMGQWVNGQPQPIHLQIQQAMFYPNAYLNFNQNGEYTKHYYNGAERIASRLGTVTLNNATTSNSRLDTRSGQLEDRFRNDIRTLVYAGDIPMDMPPEPVSATLQTTGSTTDIYYYHTNHLGSTAFVTDQNQNVTQGFLYAPFGEITTEYNSTFGNDIIPKYSFNAKELDEETGMYYYEARYYKPPVFTSRDPMFEKYFWMTPYAYCANNPVKYVDPSGEDWYETEDGNIKWTWCHNQEQMDNKKIKGSYLGITASVGDIYYGLLGNVVNKTTEEGRAIMTLDQTIIARGKAEGSGISFWRTELVDFSKIFSLEGGWGSSNVRTYSYGGGKATIIMRNKDIKGRLNSNEKNDILGGPFSGKNAVHPPRYNIEGTVYKKGPIATISFYNAPASHDGFKSMYSFLKSGNTLIHATKTSQGWQRKNY